MSRLAERVRAARRPAAPPGLVTYVTAGDPTLARTAGILRALDRAGADGDRGRRAVLRSARRRAGDPARHRTGARRRHDARGVLDLVASVRADIRGRDRDLQLRQPDHAAGRRGVRRPRPATPAWTACWCSTCRSRRRASSAPCSSRGALIQSCCSARRRPTSGCGRPRRSAAASSMPFPASASPARAIGRRRRRGDGAAHPRRQRSSGGAGVRHLEAGARARGGPLGRRRRRGQRARQRHRRGRRLGRLDTRVEEYVRWLKA